MQARGRAIPGKNQPRNAIESHFLLQRNVLKRYDYYSTTPALVLASPGWFGLGINYWFGSEWSIIIKLLNEVKSCMHVETQNN